MAKSAKRVQFAFKVDTPPGYTGVEVDIRASATTWNVSVRAKRYEPGRAYSVPIRSLSPGNKLLEISGQVPQGRIKWESLEVSSSKAPVKGAALKELVVQALQEVFPNSSATSAAEGPHGDERILLLLRGGAATRDAWNALSSAERESVASYRDLDLRGSDLAGFELGSLDFQGSDFSGSSLNGAGLSLSNLNRCRVAGADLSDSRCFDTRFHSANLEDAILARASMRQAKFRRANLERADLAGADLQGADFSGANMTGANLLEIIVGPHIEVKAGTRYDANTKFPDGFEPAPGWAKGPGKR